MAQSWICCNSPKRQRGLKRTQYIISLDTCNLVSTGIFLNQNEMEEIFTLSVRLSLFTCYQIISLCFASREYKFWIVWDLCMVKSLIDSIPNTRFVLRVLPVIGTVNKNGFVYLRLQHVPSTKQTENNLLHVKILTYTCTYFHNYYINIRQFIYSELVVLRFEKCLIYLDSWNEQFIYLFFFMGRGKGRG